MVCLYKEPKNFLFFGHLSGMYSCSCKQYKMMSMVQFTNQHNWPKYIYLLSIPNLKKKQDTCNDQ